MAAGSGKGSTQHTPQANAPVAATAAAVLATLAEDWVESDAFAAGNVIGIKDQEFPKDLASA